MLKVLDTLIILFYLIIINFENEYYYYHPHFINQDIDAQKDSVTCTRLHKVTQLGSGGT